MSNSSCRFRPTTPSNHDYNVALKVIGNQDEDRKGSEGRRNSVGVDQVSPVGGLSGDEVEDDFDEDDFEDP